EKSKPASKKGPTTVPKKGSSDSSESDSSSDEKATVVKQVSAPTPKKTEESSSSSSDDSDSEEEEENEAKGDKKPVTGKTAKKEESSKSSSDTDSSEDEAPLNKVPVASKRSLPTAGAKQSKQESDDSDDDDSSDESEDEQPAAKKSKVASDSGKDAKVVKKVSSDEEEGSEESSDEDEESDDEEETPKKKDTDVEMVDATTPQKITKQQDFKSAKKAPQTPATPQGQPTGSKTLFVGNLPYQVEQADVKNFFKDAGEIVDIRFATDAEGNFKGFGHVEFATAEAAQKALELNGEYLMNRSLRLDLARERGAYTPYSGNGNNSFQKGGRSQTQTIFVKGFDQSLGEDEIRSSLEEHFGSCGEISRVAIPVDRETGGVKGYAYLDFNDGDSFNKALELDGSELSNYSLSVDEAKPRGEFRDGPGSGRGGGRSGGRSGGWSGGRDGGGRGGRGGRRGGGRFGGAGRGRGPNKPNLAAAGTGRKTTFNDED
ncbi:Nucleolin like 2 isoform 4, partial [Theobroma cacao]